LEFHALGRRSVTGRFDGGRISSDAGAMLLREVDKRMGLTGRLSECFVDYRNPLSVEHRVGELVSQRLYAIALGYEDLNDHGQLRGDALVSLLVGKKDLTGQRRIRERDRGYALASASTLNRLELGEPEEAAHPCSTFGGFGPIAMVHSPVSSPFSALAGDAGFGQAGEPRVARHRLPGLASANEEAARASAARYRE